MSKFLVTEPTSKCFGYYGVRYIWTLNEHEIALILTNQVVEKVISVTDTEEEALKLCSQTPEICLIMAAIYEASEVVSEEGQVDRELFPKALDVAISMITANRLLRKKFNLPMSDAQEYRDFHTKKAADNTLRAKLIQAALDSSEEGHVHLAILNDKIEKIFSI